MAFSKDFLWGAASSAYQIEGGYNEDGKGLHIWDVLSAGKIRRGEDGNVACDHYHRFKEDVKLMREIGLKSYRFSVSWARIFPDETGRVNEKGLRFYSNLLDELLKAGIEPILTLYHWDLPMWLHEKGGWKWEGISDAFEVYAKTIAEAFSDRVSYWLTLNEPQCFVGLGYLKGIHAPFEKYGDLKMIAKNVMLSHGKAVKAIRERAKRSVKIGYSPTSSCCIPTEKFTEAECRKKIFSDMTVTGDAFWSDPIVLGIVPEALKGVLSGADLKIIRQPLDFYGYNVYQALNYSEDENGGHQKPPAPGMPQTSIGWWISPDVLYWTSKFLYERYKLPIMVVENGMANCDFVMEDGKVHDPQRVDYVRRYLKALKKATDDGVEVIGYQYWSLLDNIEWAEGYDKRFGLVYVDYATQERILKDSAYEYKKIIAQNGENL